MKYLFLLVSNKPSAQWASILREALSPLGKLHIASEADALHKVLVQHYAAVIVDAGAVHDVASITRDLCQRWPQARVVIATTSPTWKRAREALQAGATDYIRKSLDKKELYSEIKAMLSSSLLPSLSQNGGNI